METEFNRIYWAMRNSDTIADGEYYVIHADHVHDFKMAIDNYLEDKEIEKLGDWAGCVGEYANVWSPNEVELKNKINEIIDKINGMEDK